MYITYVIENEDGCIYIGQTNDIEKRLKRHNGEIVSKKSSYTYKNKKGKWELIHTEKFKTRSESIKREKQLKSYQGRQFIKQFKKNMVR